MRTAMQVIGLLVTGAVASLSLAGDLTGYWKMDEDPVWIEIKNDNDQLTGTVVKNANIPEATGRTMLKDVTADKGEASTWQGQVYAQKLGSFKDATITQPDADHMAFKVKVGLMSRTVTWTRITADELPKD